MPIFVLTVENKLVEAKKVHAQNYKCINQMKDVGMTNQQYSDFIYFVMRASAPSLHSVYNHHDTVISQKTSI